MIKIFILLLSLYISLLAESTSVCYLDKNNNKNVENFKNNFTKYLKKYSKYDFHIFSDKNELLKYINTRESILILSSIDYQHILRKKKLDLKFVAQKYGSIKDTRVLVGKKNKSLMGVVTSSYSSQVKELRKYMQNNSMSTLMVPKEIDALMSVGFDISDFAIISKDTFVYLQSKNDFLVKDLKIYKSVKSTYRTIVAKCNTDKNIKNIFMDMNNDDIGKLILDYLHVDKFIEIKRGGYTK